MSSNVLSYSFEKFLELSTNDKCGYECKRGHGFEFQ